MFDRILVPLDGSPESESIRSWISGIASELDSVVDILAVIEPSRLRKGDRDDTNIETLIEQESEYARNYLREQVNWFQQQGVTVASHIMSGDPAEVIINQARELDSKLIAMVTHRKSAVMRGVLGSVADRVLHATGVPIMLARPGDVVGFENGGGLPRVIVTPLDGSNFSEGAIPFAEALAKRANGQVLYVTGIAPNASYAAYTLADPAVTMDEEGNFRSRTAAYLERITERTLSRGVTATFNHIMKSAADAIIEAASVSSDRLVVMTSHGSSGIKRWLLGSVADKVIRLSEHPVIVIPPEHQQISYRGGTRRLP